MLGQLLAISERLSPTHSARGTLNIGGYGRGDASAKILPVEKSRSSPPLDLARYTSRR